MSNVVPITQKFDAATDRSLNLFREQETHHLPAFDAMLPGPATELDALPEPRPVVVRCWSSITWAFVLGFTIGVTFMIVMTGLTS